MIVEDVVAAIADHEPHIVFGAIGVVRRARDVITRLRPHVAELRSREHDLHRPERTMVKIDRDLVTHTRTLLANERAEYACCETHRCVPIANSRRPVDGLEVLRLRERGEESTTRSIGSSIEAFALSFRTIFPIATHLRPNQMRMALVNRLVIEPEFLQSLVAEARDQDVSISKELLQKRTAFFALQVHAQEVLVHRCQVERRIVDIGLLHAESWAIGAVLIP